MFNRSSNLEGNSKFSLQLSHLNITHVVDWASLLKLSCEKHIRQGKWQQQLILTQL